MSKQILLAAAASLLALSACAAPNASAPPPAPVAAAQAANPTIGGAAMDPARSIAENIGRSAEHRTLVAGLHTAGLTDRLASSGPFTLFAPTDQAFARLPAGTVESLNAPASRALFVQLLSYHLVPGAKTRSQILADISAGGGTASYQAASGARLSVSSERGTIVIRDVHGNRSTLTIADARLSNGIIHVVDAVLIPAI